MRVDVDFEKATANIIAGFGCGADVNVYAEFDSIASELDVKFCINCSKFCVDFGQIQTLYNEYPGPYVVTPRIVPQELETATKNMKYDVLVEAIPYYVHYQMVPSAEWDVVHNLGKKPSVTIVDSADNIVVGDVQYINDNEVVITFKGAFSGKAYFN